jgi:hypothetical protein
MRYCPVRQIFFPYRIEAFRAFVAMKKAVSPLIRRGRSGDGMCDGAPGLMGAGDLLPQKARILLQFGLTFSKDPEQIRKWFATLGAAEFGMSAARERTAGG